jgi:disulfide bond formation protein DsbB
MFALTLKYWPAAALLASIAMLAVAHIFEQLGYQPCALCLTQREVYWAALALGAATLIGARALPRLPVAAFGDLLLALVFLSGAGVAIYHAGAEWKFWPGPTTCAATGVFFDPKSILEALNKPMHPPACDEAAWRLAGVSMAGYNAIASVGLAVLSLIAGARARAAAMRDE